MLKKTSIYVCDSCECRAFPSIDRTCIVMTMYDIPDGWKRVKRPLKRTAHLCPDCAREYDMFKKFKEEQSKEERYNGDFGLG